MINSLCRCVPLIAGRQFGGDAACDYQVSRQSLGDRTSPAVSVVKRKAVCCFGTSEHHQKHEHFHLRKQHGFTERLSM